jgi:membrane protein DedA with SNARE-associated domain
MLLEFFDAILNFFILINYWGVFFLMTIESSFIPFPSEIVVPPAAYLAALGKLNIWLVILAGSMGSLLGALINYFLARYLGRPIVYKLLKTKMAKYLLLNEEKVKRAEDFFSRYDKGSTFFGRLIPVVRQLISLPAGFAQMNIWSFSLYTFLGAFIWTSVLAALGYFFGAHDEKLRQYYQEIVYFIVFLAILFIIYLIIKYRKKKKKKEINLNNQ